MNPSPLSFLPSGLAPHPVCLASAPLGAGSRRALAGRLWRGLGGPLSARPGTLRVGRGPWGEPLSWVGNAPGPWLSFSRLGNCLWAAMSRGARVGIDAAAAEEFAPGYPLDRLARPAEMHMTRGIHASEAEAAALLWAVKEAAVKALGVGFHFLDPREVEVVQARPLLHGFFFGLCPAIPANVWALRQGWHWLAVAVASLRPQ